MSVDRRRFLVLSGGFVIGSGVAGFASGCGLDLNLAPDASFDEVLDALHRTDLEFGAGLSNHASMAAEALLTLGASERIVPFLENYQRQLVPLDTAEPPAGLARAAGDYDARAQNIAAYDAELNGDDPLEPADILARDLPALVPNLFGDGLHGAIRTMHALRSLERDDTPSRRRELAFGLGYWVSRDSGLPGVPGAAAEAGFDIRAALAGVPLVPEAERVTGGLIVDRYEPLLDDDAFVAAVERADIDALPFDEALDALVSAVARMFVHEGKSNIALLHGITGCAAVRFLGAYADDATKSSMIAHTFHGIAAMRATASTDDGLDGVAAVDDSIDDVIARTVAIDDEHTFKLIEAVRREMDRSDAPPPELLAAAKAYVG